MENDFSFFGILQHEQQILACCQTHSDNTQAFKNAFKVGTVNFVNSPALPSIEKYAPKVKTAKGLKAMLDKGQGS